MLKSRGYSVIEMLVAMAIFSWLLTLGIHSFWMQGKNLQEQEHILKRTQLIHSLINVIGMPGSMKAAGEMAGTTSNLYRCIRGPWCQRWGGPFPLKLLLPPLYSNGTSITLSGAISGPPTAPILYNMTGQSCDPSVTTCDVNEFTIAVSTQFEIFCPPAYDLATLGLIWSGPVYPAGLAGILNNGCGRAHYFRIFYRFEKATGAPDSAFFRPVVGSVMVNSVDVALTR